MPTYNVEFQANARGTAAVVADSREEAEAEFQASVDDWGDEYLSQYIEREDFFFEAYEVTDD